MPVLPLPATEYAAMLGERMTTHGVRMWLVNTGWTGGAYGVGQRMNVHPRDDCAALGGQLDAVSTHEHPVFGLQVPASCPGVPDAVLDVRSTWADGEAYDAMAEDLAARFASNFEQFEGEATEEMKEGAPKVMSS